MEINTKDFKQSLIDTLTQIQTSISDEYRAFEFDDESGIQVTLACDDNGNDYTLQTGDNSYSGSAYFFPHWAVTGVYRDSDCEELAEDLIKQLNDLLVY